MKSQLAGYGMSLAQIGQSLAHAVVDNGGTDEDTKRIIPDDVLRTNIALLILGKLIVVTEAEYEVVLGPVIHVNRKAKILYPDWIKSLIHPELEDTGLSDYDVTKMNWFIEPSQLTGVVRGGQVYQWLKDCGRIQSCIGLRDLLAIKQKGLIFFWRNWSKKMLIGWRSAAYGRDGEVYVPYLIESDEKVVLGWRSLGHLNVNSPALGLWKT